jgi:ring-1,2-phenylacetyl-CoA epoxidase subunit PaaE
MLEGELARMKANYMQRFHQLTIFSQPLHKNSEEIGRLDQQRIVNLLAKFPSLDYNNTLFFVCGPQGMMEESFKGLHTLGVSDANIRKESFVSSSSTTEKQQPATMTTGGVSVVEITYGKKNYSFNVAAGKTILESALDQKIDLPYSCQSGMCTACMGKCISGKVIMDDPDGLSENEIKQGFVLTCVGRPASENVKIEID